MPDRSGLRGQKTGPWSKPPVLRACHHGIPAATCPDCTRVRAEGRCGFCGRRAGWFMRWRESRQTAPRAEVTGRG